MGSNLNNVKIIGKDEKDYFNGLSNIDLHKLKDRYLRKKDYMRSSYLSRLIIVKNKKLNVTILPSATPSEVFNA